VTEPSRDAAAAPAAQAQESLRLVTAQPNPFVGMSKGFFPGAERARQLDELRHLSRWSRRLLVVTGERGVGKSALFRALSGHLDTGVKAARINANLTSDAREVLSGVLQGLGVAVPARANVKLLAELVSVHVEEQAGVRRQCLVLVDDAHLLELRALEQLLQLVDSTSEDALRIVFFAETSLIPALERACRRMTNVRTWHEIRLQPFSESDCRRYTIFRLGEAGIATMPFTAGQLDVIWRDSAGLPGRINDVAAALYDGATALAERGRVLPRVHRAMVWLLSAAMLSGWLAWTNWSRHADPDAPRGTARVVAPEAGARSVAVLELPRPGEGAAARASPQSAPASRAGPAAASTPTEAGPVAAPDAVDDRVVEEAPAAEPQTAMVGSPPEPSVAASDVPTQAAPAENAAAPPPAAPDAPAPSQATAPVVIPEARGEPRLVPKATPEVKSATVVAAAKPAPVRAAAPARGLEWIRSESRTRWTLQLFGTSNRQMWQRYVDEHPGEHLAGFETRREGEPWYVVVYGSYATQADAEAAGERLPAALGRLQPWVRSFGAIQDSIPD
jgi:DamX protein